MKNNIIISRDELTGRTRIQIDIDTNDLYEQDLKKAVDYMLFRASATVDDVKRLEYTLRGLYDVLTAINKCKEDMENSVQANINSMAQQSMLNSGGLTSLPRGLANGGAPLGAKSALQQYGLLSNSQKKDVSDRFDLSPAELDAIRKAAVEAVRHEHYPDNPPSVTKSLIDRFFKKERQ